MSAFLVCLASLSALAAATPSTKQVMIYEVYAGGIHALQARLEIDMRADDYDIILDANTRGFLASLVPWEGRFESHGWVMKDGELRPRMHQSTTGWEDEVEVKEYLYNQDRSFKSLKITDENVKDELQEIDPEVTDHTTDALTATLSVLESYITNGKCEGSDEVFDGKRRFKQIFTHKQEEDLETTKYNIFEGPAVTCEVEVVPVSGEWSKKPRGWLSIQEQGRAKGTMPTVWVAQMNEKGPAVPVKIRIKTDYGTLFMHLAEYQNGDEILVAEKRVKD